MLFERPTLALLGAGRVLLQGWDIAIELTIGERGTHRRLAMRRVSMELGQHVANRAARSTCLQSNEARLSVVCNLYMLPT
jgi:hypothetical protein